LEVRVREIQEVESSEEFHPDHPHQVHRQQRGDDAERKCANEAVVERGAMLALGQAEHHHRNDEGVVGAEQSFESDEKSDGDEVGRLNHC
jgi:hypothetical protein